MPRRKGSPNVKMRSDKGKPRTGAKLPKVVKKALKPKKTTKVKKKY